MRFRREVQFLWYWLLSVLLVSLLMFQVTQQHLVKTIEEQVGHHLLLSFDEAHFSRGARQTNDLRSITYVGQQINTVLSGALESEWYSTHKSCQVSLLSVDGVPIDGEYSGATNIKSERALFQVAFPRNKVERLATLGLDCSAQWTPFLIVGAVLALLSWFLLRALPAPFSPKTRQWLEYWKQHGYEDAKLFKLINLLGENRLALSQQQQICFDHLHDFSLGNINCVMQLATDLRLNSLDNRQIDWLLQALKTKPDDMDAALAMALQTDQMCIDLTSRSLRIHGLDIPLAKTPLLYYTWYAQKRLSGDGWILNPQSNRPDGEESKALAELMWQYGGHAKAINDLEQVGLKARTLDQNRSKLKEELTAALGEELALPYLFETEKDPLSGRMRYRLKLSADQIKIHY